jgi:hypothetical protein
MNKYVKLDVAVNNRPNTQVRETGLLCKGIDFWLRTEKPPTAPGCLPARFLSLQNL